MGRDNSTLKSITNNLDANWSRAFTYDALNRVQTAQTPSSANYGVTFTVDPWGNLTNRDPITGKNVVWPLADPANKKNQLSSRTHDLAGNVTNDGVGHIYTYDAENRVYATGGVTYTYDGDGERVKKSSGMLYWTGTGTAALLETALDGTPTAEYVFFNGKRIARIDRPSNAIHYYLSDHLGSTAKVTSALGQPEEWNELGVYGEPIAGGDTRYLFTGKERDAGGEDFFGARYYAFRMGRFLTPDWAKIPAPIPYSTIGEPQSLNLYTYALNNPVTGTDPDGHLTLEGSGPYESRNFGGEFPSERTEERYEPYTMVHNNIFDQDGNWISGSAVYVSGHVGASAAPAAKEKDKRASSTHNYKQLLTEKFEISDCAALLGQSANSKKLISRLSVQDITKPDFKVSPTDQAHLYAWTQLLSNSKNAYAITQAFSKSGWVLTNANFSKLTESAQVTVLIHELRHWTKGTMGEPPPNSKSSAPWYRREYQTIHNACGTDIPR